jgi:transposase
METGYRRCCGIDVHKKSLSVCVLAPEGKRSLGVRHEVFRTFTRDLKRLRAWLSKCGVTEIVMESTGQYWRPVWNILEGAFARLVLVNPQHVKGLKGRKTDRIDSEWLARHLERDELRSSFIPPREIRELRELTRLRVHWLQDLNRAKNRIVQLCETGNIKITSVASNLFGASGRSMLASLIRGNRDAGWMADYARGRLRGKKFQLELALQGTFTDHQRSILSRLMRQVHFLDECIEEITAEIEKRMVPYEDIVRRLDGIPGIDRVTAWTVLAEIGTDMSVFGDARHLASWAALCPGNRESGGKRMSGKTRKGNPYIRRALCQSAWAAARHKQSHLAALFRRIRARRGEQKAVMAVAHELLTIIFHVLRDGTLYQELGAEHYDRQNKPKLTRRLVERLQRLGYYVTLQAAEETFPATEVAHSVQLAAPEQSHAPVRRRGRPCKCAERGIPCQHGRLSAPTDPAENLPASSAAKIPTL